MSLEGIATKLDRGLRRTLGDQGYVSIIYTFANMVEPSISRKEVEKEILYKK